MTSQSSSQKIQPAIAPVARFVWLFLTASSIFYYIWLAFQFYQAQYPVSESISTAMARLGLPAEFYLAVIIFSDALFVGTFVFMGCLMFLRRGDNPIVFSASLTLTLIIQIFSGFSVYIRGIPYEYFFLNFNGFLSFTANALILLMIYRLPDGEFVPKWSRWLFFLSILYLIAFFLSSQYWSAGFNLLSRIIVFLGPIFGIQLYRYRHVSSPLQRQQTKWVVLGIVVAALSFFIHGSIGQFTPAINANLNNTIYYRLFTLPIRNLFLIALPLGFAFAALRYRLWDVDLTLNRSLVLSVVTLVLVLLFAFDFFVAHAVLSRLLPANHEMLAGAIAAAINVAAFTPVRRFVRHIIDREIYGFRFDLNDLRAAQKRNQDNATQGSYSGRELEGYRLGHLIGRGGMGEVYEGLNGSHPVAIKALPASYFHDETARRRFEREAQATKSIKHPNVVRVLGSGIDSDLAYIILEYITGQELKTLIQEQGALSLDDTLDILRGVVAAVDAVHVAGIIHRDLKPSNIMLPVAADGESYHPVLMDFGLARLDNLGSTLTGSGAIGTVAYMSPEQFIESRSVDHRADIYALGVIAYEMLAGKPPFEGHAGNVMFAHIQQPPPDVCDIRADLPAYIGNVLQKAMAKDANERFNSANEFLAALEKPSD